nr:uncharacterized protein LOC119168745 [Rhipicephalus microplus]
MWKVLGIQATADSTTSKIEHTSDASRHLYFISDFPHLIKCLRNSLLKSGFNTPAGHVDMQHVREAHKIDSSNVTLKVMPGITWCHLDPNGFEKMRVSYAFQLFGTKVLQAFHLYKDKLEATLGRMDVTQEFFSKIHQLIRVMTSRFPAEALRPCSSGTAVLQDFLSYLKAWEQHTKGGGGFLSNTTAAGLRVTISSTLELLDYLTENVGFKYLMTAKTSQDPLENLFGIIRQSSGSNDHPTPTQFLITVNCMSFYGLVKGVSQRNCKEGMLGSLLEVSSPRDTSQNAAGMDLAPSSSPNAQALVIPSQDHSQHVARSDSRIIFYIAGNVARKCILKSNCKDCLILLTAPAPDESFQLARLTLFRDNGGLLYPSACLFRFIKKLEDLFTGCFSCEQLHADSILDALTIVKARLWQEVGCPSHVSMLSQKIIQFYVVTRLHFYIKGLNTDRAGERQKAKHLKISRCC